MKPRQVRYIDVYVSTMATISQKERTSRQVTRKKVELKKTHRIPNQRSMKHAHRIKSNPHTPYTSIPPGLQPLPNQFLNFFNIPINLLSMMLSNQRSITRRRGTKKRPNQPINNIFSFRNRVSRKKPSSRVRCVRSRTLLGSDTFSNYPSTLRSSQWRWGMCWRLKERKA